MADGILQSKLRAPAAGAVAGLVAFPMVCWFFGRPIIPTTESLMRVDPMANVVRSQAAALGGSASAGSASAGSTSATYGTTCAACHQADGKGLPGAFPALAGSEWVTGDPETPIRIVLLGIGGPIEVAGAKFNSVMPPPAGLTDAQVAEAVTHVRTQFGNTASAVDAAKVAEVRAALAGRTSPWTAEELSALRAGGAPAPAPEAAPAAGAAARLPDDVPPPTAVGTKKAP